MKTLIYVEVLNSPSYSYEKEVVSELKKNYPELTIFDLDTLSDNALFQYALTLMEEASKFALFIEVKNPELSGKLIPLMEAYLKYQKKGIVLLEGSSPIVERMLSVAEKGRVHRTEEKEVQLRVVKEHFT